MTRMSPDMMKKDGRLTCCDEGRWKIVLSEISPEASCDVDTTVVMEDGGTRSRGRQSCGTSSAKKLDARLMTRCPRISYLLV